MDTCQVTSTFIYIRQKKNGYLKQRPAIVENMYGRLKY